LRLVSTGALRNAANCKQIIDIFKNKLGLHLEIIHQEDEALFLYAGVTRDFKLNNRIFVVLNVGGSSTEVIVGKGCEAKHVYKLPDVGTVKLTEKYIQHNPPLNDEKKALSSFLLSKIHELNIAPINTKAILLHTGGELTYVKNFRCPSHNFKESLSHPIKIALDDFKKFDKKIWSMSLEDLQEIMPEPKNWINGAYFCNTIVVALAQVLGINEIVPSDKNLTDGLLFAENN
jgi:exopolyphosphatase/guanosine-5'-triphosphate,3'-diphosphate pyrophosphatase